MFLFVSSVPESYKGLIGFKGFKGLKGEIIFKGFKISDVGAELEL
jgi:hypothetical protein